MRLAYGKSVEAANAASQASYMTEAFRRSFLPPGAHPSPWLRRSYTFQWSNGTSAEPRRDGGGGGRETSASEMVLFPRRNAEV